MLLLDANGDISGGRCRELISDNDETMYIDEYRQYFDQVIERAFAIVKRDHKCNHKIQIAKRERAIAIAKEIILKTKKKPQN